MKKMIKNRNEAEENGAKRRGIERTSEYRRKWTNEQEKKRPQDKNKRENIRIGRNKKEDNENGCRKRKIRRENTKWYQKKNAVEWK